MTVIRAVGTASAECEDCGGSGDCTWCDGTGLKGGKIDAEPCEDCDGSGTCQTCHGSGQVAQQ
jgi:hypothetical protein